MCDNLLDLIIFISLKRFLGLSLSHTLNEPKTFSFHDTMPSAALYLPSILGSPPAIPPDKKRLDKVGMHHATSLLWQSVFYTCVNFNLVPRIPE